MNGEFSNDEEPAVAQQERRLKARERLTAPSQSRHARSIRTPRKCPGIDRNAIDHVRVRARKIWAGTG
jgi:hypothetical protein